MKQVKCDKCEAVATPEKTYVRQPEGWFYLTYKIDGYHNVEHDLCPHCAAKLKLKKEDRDTKAVGDRLCELIYEIVGDAVEECRGCH